MIFFKRLRYKNFLSTGNVFTELHLDKSPNTLVIGTNGAGKSTMLDALTYGLFGKTFRNINKPDLINSINDKDSVVEIEFRVGIKDYKIVRGQKPSIFEIYCEDKMVDQDGASRDYQSYLEKNILKFNYKAFTQIVVLGSSSFVPFMQLPTADRRTIIEDLLDIQIFTTMNVIVKNRLANIKATSAELKQSLEHTMAKIELQKKYVEEAKKSNQDQIKNKEKEYSENLEHITKLTSDVVLIQHHVDALFNSTIKEVSIKETLKKLTSFENKIESNKNKLVKDKDFYMKNDNCPSCKQVKDAEFKSDAKDKANTKIEEYSTAIDKLMAEQDKLNTQLTAIADVHKKISKHQSEITRINASVTQIQKYVNKLVTEINELKGKKVLSEDMTEISNKLVTDLEELHNRRKDVNDIKQYFDVASLLLKDNGVKSKIIKQYLPVINKLVNKYLLSMDFFINFEIDEEFRETIKSRHRDNFTYGNFSEGEKQKIDLALLFTWRSIAKIKNSMDTNLLILDEVFDSSLDANGTEMLMKIIGNLGADTNVFIISHKGDILVDKFRSLIKFEKIQNFSRIV